MTGLHDDEWCRRIWPLLTRRELRVCAVLGELGPDVLTSSTEIGGLAELTPRNARQVIAVLERAHVIRRKRHRSGAWSGRLLPDLDRAARTLAEWGRQPPLSASELARFCQTDRPADLGGGRGLSRGAFLGGVGSPDPRIPGSPAIRPPDHGDPPPPFSPIDPAWRRACVDARQAPASDLRSDPDQAHGGMDDQNLPPSLSPLPENTHARAGAIAITRATERGGELGGDLLSLDLGRLVSVGRELWGVRWHRSALGRWLAPLLGLEATATELEAWLRVAAVRPDVQSMKYPPSKAGDPELAAEWLAGERRRARGKTQRVFEGSEGGKEQNSAAIVAVPPPAGCSLADLDRMAADKTAARRADRKVDRPAAQVGARSAVIGAPGGAAGPSRVARGGASPIGGLLGSVLAGLGPPAEQVATSKAIGGE